MESPKSNRNVSWEYIFGQRSGEFVDDILVLRSKLVRIKNA